jgi:hypothetical protein
MKAEHRHELKTNDLAIWLSNLPNWTKENLRTVIYVAVVIVLVIASAIYYHYQNTVLTGQDQEKLATIVSQLQQQKAYIAQKQSQGEDNSFMLLSFVDQLETIAKSSSNDAVVALALIKEAEVLRTELQMRFGPASQQDINTPINKAQDLYNKALTRLKNSPNPTLEAMAKNGLGLCEEELGNTEAARKLYQEVATSASYEGTVPAIEARQRLTAMDSLKEKVVLKPMPRAKVQAAPAPAATEPNSPVQN